MNLYDSRLLFEDQEYGLFTVALFQKVVDEFKLHARENRLITVDLDFIMNF